MGEIYYTNTFSKLPDQIMSLHHYKDVTNTVTTTDKNGLTQTYNMADIVNEIKKLQADCKYDEAASLLEQYGLQDYILSAKDMNFIDEETRNLEIMCMSKRQSVFYMNDEPLFIDITKGDVWIGG